LGCRCGQCGGQCAGRARKAIEDVQRAELFR